MGEVQEYPNGTSCSIDLGTTDIEGAKAFYSGLFAWETEDVPAGDSETYRCVDSVERTSRASMHALRHRGRGPHVADP